MRWTVVTYYVGLFLRIFSVLLLVPVAVGRYYGESFVVMEPFLIASFLAIVFGSLLTRVGADHRPETVEAMAIATFAWILAVGLGAIPVYTIADVSIVDAYFDAMAGFTTTGMDIIPAAVLAELPYSLLFWRVFMQWIGGLGILTFFVMVLSESGGVASKLVSQEANKTDSGVIRPSLFNAIKSMWYVYIVLTIIQAILLYMLAVPAFHAVGHAMATLPTGGFTTTGDFAGMMGGGGTQAVLTVFMFLGATNFLLIYALFQGDIWRMIRDFEFRVYFSVFAVALALIALDLIVNTGRGFQEAVSTSLFHTASIVSSSGFTLEAVGEFPTFSKALIVIIMFIGGSLGSTTGGFKMLRFGVMFKVVRQHVKSLTLPPTVMNPVVVKGRILKDRELIEITSFFFIWLGVIVTGGLITIWFSPHGVTDAIQLMTSAVGTMGPTFITGEELRQLPGIVKISLSLGMLAGRLEMLPILVLLNRGLGRWIR